MAGKRQRGVRAVRAFVDLRSGVFAKHNLLTWASAIAFQVLVALVPLTVLALAVLGSTFHAVDYAAERILMHASAGLLAFGIVLTGGRSSRCSC